MMHCCFLITVAKHEGMLISGLFATNMFLILWKFLNTQLTRFAILQDSKTILWFRYPLIKNHNRFHTMYSLYQNTALMSLILDSLLIEYTVLMSFTLIFANNQTIVKTNLKLIPVFKMRHMICTYAAKQLVLLLKHDYGH